jgi:hypothetical protein
MTMPIGSPVLVCGVDFFMNCSLLAVNNRSAGGENGRRQPMSGALPLGEGIRSQGATFPDSRILVSGNRIPLTAAALESPNVWKRNAPL